MRRTAVASLVLLATTVGCGPSGPPPLIPAPATPTDPAAAVKAPTAADKPAASDPDAVKLVHAALDAHTTGDRSKLRKFRTVECERKGVGRGLEGEPFDLKWAIASEWPDRIRVVAEFPGPKTITLARSGTTAWQRLTLPGGAAGPVETYTPARADNLRIDNTGQWLWLLFPLDDAEAVFAPAPPAEVAGASCPGVHLFHPRLAPAALHFHPDTKLLTRIAYEGREGDKPGVQVFQAVENKPYHGVQVAHRLAQAFDGREYANLALVSLEPKAKLDDALFAAPR